MRQQIEINVDLTFNWLAMAEGKSERLEGGLREARKDDSGKRNSGKSCLCPAAMVSSLILAFLLVIFTVTRRRSLKLSLYDLPGRPSPNETAD